MMLDLLVLVRQEYAKKYPDRDTRQMPIDDTLVSLAYAVEGELERLNARLKRLERKQLDEVGE